MIFTTPTTVRELAADLGLTASLPVNTDDPTDAVLLRLIARASNDVEIVLGTRVLDASILTVRQAAALSAATAWQTVLLAAQGNELGDDDLLTSIPNLSFAPPTRAPRVSPRVRELLGGLGLIQRSGTLPPQP